MHESIAQQATSPTAHEASLDTLHLPTRMANFVARRALKTVGELARLHPAALLLERNLGRTTVAQTRVVLEEALGMRWEEAATGRQPDADGDRDDGNASNARDRRWRALARSLPARVLQRSVEDVAIPARARTFARAQGVQRVADLVDVSWSAFASARNVGRQTASDTLAQLEHLATTQETPHAPVSLSEWKRLLCDALAGLPTRERLVMTQRAGLAGPAPTLQQIGEMLGVSRERVRQLERDASSKLRRASTPLRELATALRAASTSFAERIDAGPRQVVSGEDDFEPFIFLVESTREGAAPNAFVHADQLYFGNCTAQAFTEARNRLQQAADTLQYPCPREDFPTRLAEHAGLGSLEVTVLFPLLEPSVMYAGDEVVGFGARRGDAVVALLRELKRPVAVTELIARLGRFGRMPNEVVWVDRGLVTLPEFVPDYSTWAARIGPLVASLMAEHGDQRQWSAAELVPLLEEAADTPEWFNEHTLMSMLRQATDSVVYLGRGIVRLGDAAGAERAHMLETIEAVLETHGAPMLEDELLRKVREVRAVAPNTWNLQRMRAPLVLLEGDRIGLAPRDLPIGADAARAVIQTIYDWLEDRDRGATSRELVGVLAGRGLADTRLVRSLLRHDGRFLLAQGGGVGLVAWGEVRTPTQREALLELLETGGGRVSVAHAVANLPTASGDAMPRVRLQLLARTCGARVVGDEVTVDTHAATRSQDTASLTAGGEPVGPRSAPDALLLTLPERASATFAALYPGARAVGELRSALLSWRAELLANDAPTIDRDQVRALAAKADHLLARPEASEDTPEGQALRTAVEYLVCVHDGELDTVIGGLDDDAAVLALVGG